jgi:hypothetical protein
MLVIRRLLRLAPAFQYSSTTAARPTNSPFYNLSPTLTSMYRVSFQQQLLAGFGFGPNLRYLRIANNNKKISDIAFKDQVIGHGHADREHLLGLGECL